MLKERLSAVYSHRRILKDAVILQFKSKYAGSKLGIWWAVITPLVLAICINFIFTAAFKVDIPNYTLFVLAGIIPWLFFTNAIMEAANAFIADSQVLRQGIFPREIVPIASVCSNFLNFFVGFVFLLPVFILLNFKIVNALLFLFVIMFFHTVFTIGLGLLFSWVNVFFRDLIHFLSIAFIIWFWITPIFYSLDMLDFPYRLVCILNPMSYYVLSYREILFEGKVPSWLNLSCAILLAFVSFFIGYISFLKTEPLLLKRL